MQFIPLVEREAAADNHMGLTLAEHPDPADENVVQSTRITPWSVRREHYGDLLCAIFDQWVRRDVGSVFVQLFDVTLGNWAGKPGGLCVFSQKCGDAMAVEHNGNVYSCDHYVYPQYRLGNFMTESLGEMVGSKRQRKFGAAKADTLPATAASAKNVSPATANVPSTASSTHPSAARPQLVLCRLQTLLHSHGALHA